MLIEKDKVGLWIVDVQEGLLPHIDRHAQVLERLCYIIEAARLLQLPILVTEQAPQKLGETVKPIKERLGADQVIYPKTTFSGFFDPHIRQVVENQKVNTWIVVGIEAHICVLQTAKDLIHAKKQVVVPNDAVSSRSLYDFSTAIGELRDCSVRISSVETLIYEYLRDADTEAFKQLLPLIKMYA